MIQSSLLCSRVVIITHAYRSVTTVPLWVFHFLVDKNQDPLVALAQPKRSYWKLIFNIEIA
jgi:hypothetical protein